MERDGLCSPAGTPLVERVRVTLRPASLCRGTGATGRKLSIFVVPACPFFAPARMSVTSVACLHRLRAVELQVWLDLC